MLRTQNPEFPAAWPQIHWFKVPSSEALLPGSSLECWLTVWQPASTSYLVTTKKLEIFDPHHRVAAFQNEYVQAMWMQHSARFETFGEYGLIRDAVASEDIAVEETKTVEIHLGGTASGIEVEAQNTWIPFAVSEDDELRVKYFPENEAWAIIDQGCGS